MSPPVILDIPKDRGVLAGDNITLNCTAGSQDGMLTITWTTTASGEEVSGADEYNMDDITVVSSLILSSVGSSHCDTYMCTVENRVMIPVTDIHGHHYCFR